jgi:hypothetical protein
VNQYGYWVELSGQTFDDTTTQWIHALPYGEYEHPVYGTMKFDPETVQQFADGVNTKVRGIDLDVDYDHKDKNGKAAGWVKEAKVQQDGLHLRVEWTPEGAKSVKDKEYRYFSPEFKDEWKDAKGATHKNVLFGGALTNRPYLKDLMPVNLSELTDHEPEGGSMGPEDFKKLLGLDASATDEQVKAAIQQMKDEPAPPAPAPTPPSPTPTPEPVLTGAALAEAITKALAEDPRLKKLAELESTIAQTQQAQKLAEVKDRLKTVTQKQGGRAYVLPPSVIDAVAEATVNSDPVKMSEGFVTAMEAFGRTGFVELGERGRMATGGEKDATTQLAEAVTAKQTAHMQATGKPLLFAEAIRAVVSESPELYMEYRQDSYAGEEN